VYWGGDDSATDIYKVRQIDPETGLVVEHDYFMGFGGVDAPKVIKNLYLRHLGQARFGGVEKVSPDELEQFRDKEQKADAIPEGHHWVKRDDLKNGGYIRRNWWEDSSPEQLEEDTQANWDELRYDAPNKDDWDDSDYIIDHAMQQSGKVFNKWIGEIGDWVGTQGSLEDARDNIAELYKHLDGKKLTQTLEQGMLLADLGGRLAVVEESAEDQEETDTETDRESENSNARVEGGEAPRREI
jgi:hypothetical protein